jgi:serine/threonine-protein kinase
MRPDEPEDDPSFSLLEAYLQDLHAGRAPDRVRLLAEHPELADMLACIEAVEQLVPAGFHPSQGALTLPAGQPMPADASPGAPGADFGNYELVEEIGRGGMGVIWKARQKDLDRVVAIKMILSSHLASTMQVDRFVAEARAMAKLHHPHVVRIHETGQVHGQHYFVMEYIAGPSLAAALARGRLPREKAAELVATVARAVEHLHGQNIVHRDLKPSNILLDTDGLPYVTDFGLVKLLDPGSHVTTTGAIVGTPAYMAPEQAAGRAEEVGPRSDVYSLGAILYECLTGLAPFKGETALETLLQVMESEPPQPRQLDPDIPRKLEMICLKCMEKDPAERYSSAAAVAKDLERFLEGEEVEARPPGVWSGLRRWARREPALVSRLGALLIFTMIVHVNYQLQHAVSLGLHMEVLGLLALWAAASVIFQWGLGRERWAPWVPYAWVTVDAALLTGLLRLAQSEMGPLLIGYPFLIAASGLWFRVPVVWYTTAVLEVAYLVAIWSSYDQGTAYRMPHHHGIFMVALVVLGLVMAYQVQRFRALSRYCEHRQRP